jgi:hypothetical protein
MMECWWLQLAREKAIGIFVIRGFRFGKERVFIILVWGIWKICID